jgi:ribonuclease PH
MVLTQVYKPAYVEQADATTPHPPPISRRYDEMRSLNMEIGLLSQATGSAYLQQGDTIVLCAVFGPYPGSRQGETSISSGELICEVSIAPGALIDVSSGQEKVKENEYSILLKSTLLPGLRLFELPKCIVRVKVLILQARGGEIGCAVSASSLALADAGVPMNGLVVGCTAARVKEQALSSKTGLLLDPSQVEMQQCSGFVTVAAVYSDEAADSDEGGNKEAVSQFIQSGSLKVDEVGQAMNLCLAGCRQVKQEMEKCMMNVPSR